MSERATLGRDDFAAICAFRYCLGRMTYIVGDCVDWLCREWPLLSEHARQIIERDLREAIESDDRDRASGASFKTLGWDCYRQLWESLLRRIERA